VKEQEEIQKKGVDRLRELYKEANSLKANRQIQACEITPPDSKRRKSAPGGGGSAPAARFANCKGRLMKKARMEYVNSNEAKMHAAMRKKPVTASNSRQVTTPVAARQPPKIGNTVKK
jgi:elongin-A